MLFPEIFSRAFITRRFQGTKVAIYTRFQLPLPTPHPLPFNSSFEAAP